MIDYYYFPGKTRQLDAYNVALRKYGRQYRYMAFLDCDEFMYSDKSLYETIDEMFQKQTNMGGLGVDWMEFGSAGHVTRPDGGVIENYKWRAKGSNRIIKTVAIPTRVMAFVSPHYPIYRRGYSGYDEKGEKTVKEWTKTDTTQCIRINHYFTKSKEDWIEKVNRGCADGAPKRAIELFEERDSNEVFDDRLCRTVETLRAEKAK